MKYLIIFLVLFSSCSHTKWLSKNIDSICSKCPKIENNIIELMDTSFYSIIPADTCYIEGLDFPNGDVIINNAGYKIIKEKGKTIVITKEKIVNHVITKYKNNSNTVKTIEVIKEIIPYYVYAIGLLLLIIGYLIRKIFWQ